MLLKCLFLFSISYKVSREGNFLSHCALPVTSYKIVITLWIVYGSTRLIFCKCFLFFLFVNVLQMQMHNQYKLISMSFQARTILSVNAKLVPVHWFSTSLKFIEIYLHRLSIFSINCTENGEWSITAWPHSLCKLKRRQLRAWLQIIRTTSKRKLYFLRCK